MRAVVLVALVPSVAFLGARCGAVYVPTALARLSEYRYFRRRGHGRREAWDLAHWNQPVPRR